MENDAAREPRLEASSEGGASTVATGSAASGPGERSPLERYRNLNRERWRIENQRNALEAKAQHLGWARWESLFQNAYDYAGEAYPEAAERWRSSAPSLDREIAAKDAEIARLEAEHGYSPDLLTDADRRLQPRSVDALSQLYGHGDRVLYNEALADAELDALSDDTHPNALALRLERAKAKERLAEQALSRLGNGYALNLLFDVLENDSVEALGFFGGAPGAKLGVKGLQGAVDGAGLAGAGTLLGLAAVAALFPDEAEAVNRPRLRKRREGAQRTLGAFLGVDMPPGTGLYAEFGGHHPDAVAIYMKRPGYRTRSERDFVMTFTPEKGFSMSRRFMAGFEDPAERAALNAAEKANWQKKRLADPNRPEPTYLMPGDLVHRRITDYQQAAYRALRKTGASHISRAEHNRIAVEAMMAADIPHEVAIQMTVLANRVFRKARMAAVRNPAYQARFKELRAIADPEERLRRMRGLKLELRVGGKPADNPATERLGEP